MIKFTSSPKHGSRPLRPMISPHPLIVPMFKASGVPPLVITLLVPPTFENRHEHVVVAPGLIACRYEQMKLPVAMGLLPDYPVPPCNANAHARPLPEMAAPAVTFGLIPELPFK